MKKIVLIMLIALFAVGFVFADYGKIIVGGKAGYLPQMNAAQFDITGRWQLDYSVSPMFTTDLCCNVGLITNFKGFYLLDSFIGAGLSYNLAEKWNVYANCGLDLMTFQEILDLGVAANIGCEFYIVDNIAVGGNFKFAEYFRGYGFIFKPSIGMTYSF